MDGRTMTEAQALARVEQIIKETVAVVRPEPRLDLYAPSLNSNMCLDPTDGGSEDRIVVNRSYYLRGIPQGKISEVVGQIKKHWEQQGYYISGVSANGRNMTGRSRPDDFLLSLLSAYDGDDVVLSMGASSPCIWPDGTPEPSSSG
ncbi:hypothetical protein SAMN05216275_105280 [Streptosporangium canum]|uniref:Uncharacterized protein n=1 Tax=Streptosporangium canum TaxID=324952 RepID=A0A1I3LVR2_9ACTN|nr:hypothetical protein SAMN05216275_105280 [Streptosporangium canum]